MFRSITSPVAGMTYDDIIFQARNQTYGAFVLRQQYRPTLNRALGLGVGLFLLGLSGPMLYDRFWPKGKVSNEQVMTEVTLTHIEEPAPEPPIPLPPSEPAPSVNTVRNLPPIVLPEADLVEDNLPPTTEQLKEATSGPVTAEGTGDIEVIAPPETKAATVQEQAIEVKTKPDEIFLAVEQQPQFPGGMEALSKFLRENLTYPRSAASSGVSGRVYISFVVNADGKLTDVQVLKGIGFGCDEEAVRVIQKMPAWKPGKQSGRPVRVKYNLPISFTLE